MPLQELMEKTTNRQYEAWMEWLSARWEETDLTDYYLMQLALEVRRSYARKGSKCSIDDFRIKFRRRGDQSQDWQARKAAWMALINPKRPPPKPAQMTTVPLGAKRRRWNSPPKRGIAPPTAEK